MKMTNTITGRRLGPCDGQTATSSPGASGENSQASAAKKGAGAVETAIAEDAK